MRLLVRNPWGRPRRPPLADRQRRDRRVVDLRRGSPSAGRASWSTGCTEPSRCWPSRNTAIHVLTTVADGFTPIGLQDAVIPFASPYRRLWLGLGTLAFDLLLAVPDPHQRPAPQDRAAHVARGALDRLRMLAAGARARTRHRIRHAGSVGLYVDRDVPFLGPDRGGLARRRGLGRRPPHARARGLARCRRTSGPGALGRDRTARPELGPARRNATAASRASVLRIRRLHQRRERDVTPNPVLSTHRRGGPPARRAGVRPRRGGHSHLPSRRAEGGARDPIEGQPLGGGGVAMQASRVTLGPPNEPSLYRGRAGPASR